MKLDNSHGKKTLREAVEEGSFIDVSEAAKKAGLRCRAFVCATFWDKGLGRSHDELDSILYMFAGFYNFVFDYHHFGPLHPVGVPDLSKDEFKGYCTGILEPNDEFGLALVIIGYRTENQLKLTRTTGNGGEYAN